MNEEKGNDVSEEGSNLKKNKKKYKDGKEVCRLPEKSPSGFHFHFPPFGRAGPDPRLGYEREII